MQFIGVDLHANKFTCCCRDENSVPDGKKATQTFGLSPHGIAQFYPTLTEETHVPIEAAITTFCFSRPMQPSARQVIAANTYELKQISLARKNTDKADADILCRILKTQVLSGEKTISPAVVPPIAIQELRGLFSACRFYEKQTAQIKNRMRSLLKERLHGFTQEEIFTQKQRKAVRALEKGSAMSFQTNELFDGLEFMEARVEPLRGKIMEHAEPFTKEIQILTRMKGIGVFIAIAIIADIINVERFGNSKAFASYLRSAPKAANSNTAVNVGRTSKKGR